MMSFQLPSLSFNWPRGALIISCWHCGLSWLPQPTFHELPPTSRGMLSICGVIHGFFSLANCISVNNLFRLICPYKTFLRLGAVLSFRLPLIIYSCLGRAYLSHDRFTYVSLVCWHIPWSLNFYRPLMRQGITSWLLVNGSHVFVV